MDKDDERLHPRKSATTNWETTWYKAADTVGFASHSKDLSLCERYPTNDLGCRLLAPTPKNVAN